MYVIRERNFSCKIPDHWAIQRRDDVSIIRDLSISQDRCKVCHEFHVSQCNGNVRDERWTRRFAMTFVDVGIPESRCKCYWLLLLTSTSGTLNYTWLRSRLISEEKCPTQYFGCKYFGVAMKNGSLRSDLCYARFLISFWTTWYQLQNLWFILFFFSLTCSAAKTKWSRWVLIYVLLVHWRYDHLYTINLCTWTSEIDLGIQLSIIRQIFTIVIRIFISTRSATFIGSDVHQFRYVKVISVQDQQIEDIRWKTMK